MAHGQRIPEGAIDQVLASVDIAEVVRASGVELRGNGAEKLGMCPFHGGQSPKLGVNTTKQIFKCFVCGVGGDAIDFVQKYDDVDFPTAVGRVAAMGGVHVPELEGRDAKPMSDEQKAELERKRSEATERREAQREAEEEEQRRLEGLALDVFNSAPVDNGDGLAARYLQGRGIDTTAAWPAGFCADLRGGEGIKDYRKVEREDGTEEWIECRSTMLVGLLRDARGRPVGVQRIYLDTSDGQVRKRGGDAPNKLTLGTAHAACVRLSEVDPLDMESPRLIVDEGIETGAAVMAAMHGQPVWSALSTSGLRTFDLPDAMCGKLHAFIVAADNDRRKKNGDEPGLDSGRVCCERVHEQSPETIVRIALPSPDDAFELFGDGEPLGKSVDWLDVSLASGPAVVAGAMDGAPEWRGEKDDVRSEADHGGRGVPTSGGGGGGDDEDGDGLDDDDLNDFEWGGPRFSASDGLRIARNLLLDLWAPGKPAGSRWTIAWHDGNWWLYHEAELAWKVEPEERVFAVALHHMRTNYRVQNAKTGSWKPFMPQPRAVEAILKAMRTECTIYEPTFRKSKGERPRPSMPMWAMPTFDERGEPLWASGLRDYGESAGPIDRAHAMACHSGVFDLADLVRGRLRRCELSPLWFAEHVSPWTIDTDAVEDVLDEDACAQGVEGLELYRKACPNWIRFIESAYEGEVGVDSTVLRLQEYFGSMLTIWPQSESMGMFIGPPGAGKGTTIVGIQTLLGPGAVHTCPVLGYVDRWRPLAMVGKRMCITPDGDLDKRDPNARRIGEAWKSTAAGDPTSIEKHGQGFKRDIVPSVGLAIFANEPIPIPDVSGALADRMLGFRLDNGGKRKDGDDTLKDKIAGEGEGLFLWAMFGLRRWLRNGRRFTADPKGDELVAGIREGSNPILEYLLDACVFGPGQGCLVQAMYRHYKSWCEDRGREHPVADNTFGQSLVASGFKGVKKMRPTMDGQRLPNCYMGVRPLRPGEQPEKAEARMITEAGQLEWSVIDSYAVDSPHPTQGGLPTSEEGGGGAPPVGS